MSPCNFARNPKVSNFSGCALFAILMWIECCVFCLRFYFVVCFSPSVCCEGSRISITIARFTGRSNPRNCHNLKSNKIPCTSYEKVAVGYRAMEIQDRTTQYEARIPNDTSNAITVTIALSLLTVRRSIFYMHVVWKSNFMTNIHLKVKQA